MRHVTASLLLLGLAACGSGNNGGGTPTPTSTPANTAPVFTSAGTANLAENLTLAYQAQATDGQSGTLTFSIAGGADAARFAITSGGALSFLAAPNFELPSDSNGDNIYQVQLAVSDGTLSATHDVQVTVTNSAEGIIVKRVATGFDQPVFVQMVNGDHDRIWVVEKTGKVWQLTPATGAKQLMFTVANISTDGERGVLGLVQTVDILKSRVLIFATAPDGTIEIRAYVIGQPGYAVQLSVPHPGSNNHNGGWLGVDGPTLYIATGDGGGVGDPNNNAQNPNSRLGKILRAHIDDSVGTSVPQILSPHSGNPYASGGGDPWVYALGLRNPFRASIGADGTLIIGDVGQDAIEEINLLPRNQPGLNFGWPFLEGTQPYRGTAPAGLTPPVSQYAHGTGPKEGRSIIGGTTFSIGTSQAYVFGDFVSGNIWSVPLTGLAQGSLYPSASYERRNLDFTPDAGTLDQVVSFGKDGAGKLYIVDLDGDIFQVTQS